MNAKSSNALKRPIVLGEPDPMAEIDAAAGMPEANGDGMMPEMPETMPEMPYPDGMPEGAYAKLRKFVHLIVRSEKTLIAEHVLAEHGLQCHCETVELEGRS